MKKNLGDLIPFIVIIITIILMILFAYIISISDLPDWMKFYLLSR